MRTLNDDATNVQIGGRSSKEHAENRRRSSKDALHPHVFGDHVAAIGEGIDGQHRHAVAHQLDHDVFGTGEATTADKLFKQHNHDENSALLGKSHYLEQKKLRQTVGGAGRKLQGREMPWVRGVQAGLPAEKEMNRIQEREVAQAEGRSVRGTSAAVLPKKFETTWGVQQVLVGLGLGPLLLCK